MEVIDSQPVSVNHCFCSFPGFHQTPTDRPRSTRTGACALAHTRAHHTVSSHMFFFFLADFRWDLNKKPPYGVLCLRVARFDLSLQTKGANKDKSTLIIYNTQ